MGNKQQQHYLSAKRKREEAQLQILKALNERGPYEHNGVICWDNPLDNSTMPQALQLQWLEEEYGIIYDKSIGEYRLLIDNDEKKQRERKREYRSAVIAQRRKNQASKMQTDDKTLWVNVTGCAVRKEPWIKAFIDAPQMLARLTLLACHLQYNDRHLAKQRTNGKIRMIRKDAARILQLNNKTFQETWTYGIEHGYIVGDDSTGYVLYLPLKYGRLQDKDAQGHLQHQSKLTQILDTGVYERLYNRGGYICDDYSLRPLTPRDHHLVGKILQLTPYIQRDTNILCCNPLCSPDNIESLSTVDVARLIGSDAAHSSRDVDRLCRITFPVGGQGEELQQYVLARVNAANGKTQYYAVNPLLLCHASVDVRDKLRTQISFIATDKGTGEVL